MLMRTLIAAWALAAVAPAVVQAAASPADELGGIVVPGQPRDAYVIRLNTQGKAPAAIRQEIWSAAWTACQRAPRTANILEMRPTAMHGCATEAAWRGMVQLEDILEKRAQGPTVSIYAYEEFDFGE